MIEDNQTIDLEEMFTTPTGAFVLQVAGESMIDEGIMDGGYVAVRPSKTIENGEIAVVLLDDETTVKRIYIRRDRIALQPANEAAGYKTKYVKRGSKRVQIVGRVIGCLRKM